MSKSIVVSPVVVVSAESFAGYVANITKAGASLDSDLIMACLYVSQCTTKASQDKAKKEVAKAYQVLRAKIQGGEFKLEAAQLWVSRKVKAVAIVGFKWQVSKSANAVTKAKAKAKAPAKQVTKAKAPAKPVTSIEQMRVALIAKERAIADEYRGVIPSGKIKDFDQAFAAFILTIEMILK